MAKIHRQDQQIKQYAQNLANMQFDDAWGMENYMFGVFFNEYIRCFIPKIEDYLQKIFSVSDDILKDLNIKIPVNTDTHKVFYTTDYVSHSNISGFIVIQQKIDIRWKTDIRLTWDNDETDYKDGCRFIHRPSIKWYADRGYSCEYEAVDEDNIPLRSYGDCRDDGFILTFKTNMLFDYLKKDEDLEDSAFFDLDGYEIEKGSLGVYDDLQRIVSEFQKFTNEIKEANDT